MAPAEELPDYFRLLVAYPQESPFLPLAQALVDSIAVGDVAAWKANGLGHGAGGAGLRAAVAPHDAPVGHLLEIERYSAPLITLVRQGNAVLVDSFCPGSTGPAVAASSPLKKRPQPSCPRMTGWIAQDLPRPWAR